MVYIKTATYTPWHKATSVVYDWLLATPDGCACLLVIPVRQRVRILLLAGGSSYTALRHSMAYYHLRIVKSTLAIQRSLSKKIRPILGVFAAAVIFVGPTKYFLEFRFAIEPPRLLFLRRL